MCYHNLPPILRENLDKGCNAISGKGLNINSLDLAGEVIEAMKNYKYYGTWVTKLYKNSIRNSTKCFILKNKRLMQVYLAQIITFGLIKETFQVL